jgi:hypothetical protein
MTSARTLSRQMFLLWNRIAELDDERLRKLFDEAVEVREIAHEIGDRDPGRQGSRQLHWQDRRCKIVIVGDTQLLAPAKYRHSNNDLKSWNLPYALIRFGSKSFTNAL